MLIDLIDYDESSMLIDFDLKKIIHFLSYSILAVITTMEFNFDHKTVSP